MKMRLQQLVQMNIKKVGLANYPKHLLANGGSSPNGRYPVQKPRQTPLTLAVFPIFGSLLISLLGLSRPIVGMAFGLWVFQVY
jgi:hypothetical protein